MNESKIDNDTGNSSEANSGITVEVFGRTDVGLVREHNEDNFLVADLTARNRSLKPEVRNHTLGPYGSIFVVCDGMGGAAAGEVASQIGVDTIYDMMLQAAPPADDDELAQRLEKAVFEAGRRILTAAKLNRAQRGMGTTVTAACLIGPRLLVGQVGDSRAYILRGRQFVQITKDQSLVQQLIDANQMTEEEAKTFDKNNIILQALGTAEEVHVDVTSALLKRGDVLVMCSDGLSGLLDNGDIRNIVLDAPSLLDACRMLTEKACDEGGHDNITVIVAEFDGDDLSPPPDVEVDGELVYNRFDFSRAGGDTSTRRALPDKPKEEEEEQTVIVEKVDSPQKEEKASASEPQERSKGAALVGVAAAVVILIVATIIFLSNGSGKPVAQQPSETEVLPAPSSAKIAPAIPPSSKSVKQPPGEQNVGAEPPPELAPTPEEDITSKEPEENSAEKDDVPDIVELPDEPANTPHESNESEKKIAVRSKDRGDREKEKRTKQKERENSAEKQPPPKSSPYSPPPTGEDAQPKSTAPEAGLSPHESPPTVPSKKKTASAAPKEIAEEAPNGPSAETVKKKSEIDDNPFE